MGLPHLKEYGEVTPEQALQVLDQARQLISATPQVHGQIQQAIQVLRGVISEKATDRAEASVKSIKK